MYILSRTNLEVRRIGVPTWVSCIVVSTRLAANSMYILSRTNLELPYIALPIPLSRVSVVSRLAGSKDLAKGKLYLLF